MPTVSQALTTRRNPILGATSALPCVLAFLMISACGGDAADSASAEAGAAAAEHHEESEATRVTLSIAAHRTAAITIAPVSATPAAETGEDLEVPGEVEVDPRRIAVVSSRTAGRVERLLAIAGERVEEGQAVAELFTAEYAVAQADLQQAARRSTLLAGTRDSAGAAALVAAARGRLRLLGATEVEVRRVESGGEPSGTLPIAAPLSGSVLESHVLAGAAVESGQPIFTVADLSVVDVVAEVPERSIALVRAGQRATVTIAALPGVRFDGSVERLKDALNSETRTVQAVIHVPNTGRRLRPGMFASVSLSVSTRESLGARGSVLTVASSAVVSEGERRFVFVEMEERTYVRREVRVAPLVPLGSAGVQADRVVVLDGLRAGERVVVRGAFTLKSELAKASLSDDH